MSRRFHQLVTTPHAWRIAFTRFFPGVEALDSLDPGLEASNADDIPHAEKRLFTRLTALASWRSEYILRTRLLRSLSRGKPMEALESKTSGPSRASTINGGNAHVTYNSDLVTIVNHLHATFGTSSNKRIPRFIHGATDVGMASSSDPKTGKVDSWGFADAFSAQHFVDVYPGDALYGLGSGEVIGTPNSMDISQPFGMVYVEGLPGGRAYYRSTEEKRGRILLTKFDHLGPDSGIPSVPLTETLTSTWIAKSSTIPDISEGLVGIFVGSSQGLLSAYSLGTNPLGERRLERGELTARWVLSPGVPIIAITVDENYSLKRQFSKRCWAVALNALGEIFYLTELPARRPLNRALMLHNKAVQSLAWEAGRTVHWKLVKPSARKARPDPFNVSHENSGYTPRGSWDGMGLGQPEITAETKEINDFLTKKPAHFQKVCDGWNMRRRLEVDFAASDENGLGEGIIVINCALDDGSPAEIKRYTRSLLQSKGDEPSVSSATSDSPRLSSASPSEAGGIKLDSSLFSDTPATVQERPSWSFDIMEPVHSAGQSEAVSETSMAEDWLMSHFSLSGLRSPQITASIIDSSSLAVVTTSEDPLICKNGSSNMTSPMSRPHGQPSLQNSSIEVPGQRARLLAVGTNNGTIALWNMRAPTTGNATLENSVKPVRIIHTESPQVSCLALTALYLVHGGNDGLVQAWDPLASTTEPIRTLNSRFSSRARRRLVQAEASPAGVGINLFAAGAIFLDPDPTVLRGMVSLGSHLRYWSYSSQAADQYKGNKRRLRRAERGSNQGADRFSGTGRGALKDYIANEKLELEREKRVKRKEDNKLAARFGVDLLGPGATEDEILAYATLLSEEAARDDEQRRKSTSDGSSCDTITEEAVVSPGASTVSSSQEEFDDDMSEAIRLSLQESNGFRASSLGDDDASASSFTVRYAKSKKSSPSRSPPTSSSSSVSPKASGATTVDLSKAELNEIEFALQLSQAEEESRVERQIGGGKGKGRAF